MALAEFIGAPSKERHSAYSDSMFSGTAPEYSTGEVLLASAYRRLLLGVSEANVDLGMIEKMPEYMAEGAGGAETWRRLVLDRGGLASPFRGGQSGPMASRQLMPLVPSVATVAGVLGRRPRSRWNPSNLLVEVIASGLPAAEGATLLANLGIALSVGADDDAFARFAEHALHAAWDAANAQSPLSLAPKSVSIEESDQRAFHPDGGKRARTPSERFCRDLQSVLALKPRLTRRQWSVLVEATLRLGLGMHALWMCKINDVAFEMLERVAAGAPAPSLAEIDERVWPQQGCMLLELGGAAKPLIMHHIERYAYARTGINLLLFMLDDVGASWTGSKTIGFSAAGASAAAALKGLVDHVAGNQAALNAAGNSLRGRLGALFDESEELRGLARCKTGYTNNLREFVRHSLGQIQARVAADRCYDLAYLLSSSKESQLNVQPGPDMLLTLVHACCEDNPNLPVSLDDFRTHLAAYGLRVPAGELVDGETGRALTRLGLVVDSPDAAGGSLLVSPFD